MYIRLSAYISRERERWREREKERESAAGCAGLLKRGSSKPPNLSPSGTQSSSSTQSSLHCDSGCEHARFQEVTDANRCAVRTWQARKGAF